MARKKRDLEGELALLIQAAGLPEPVRQFRFHPVRRWRLDFAWPGLMVLCEVEGGTYGRGAARGRHVRPVGYTKDCEKYNEAALAGWTVIRVTSGQIDNGQAIEWLYRALQAQEVEDGDDNREMGQS